MLVSNYIHADNYIGSCATISKKIFAKAIKIVSVNNEITKPVIIQTAVCNKPITSPTKKYPSIKSQAFMGEENNLFRKKDCLSLETLSARVSITKEYEKTIMAGKREVNSKVGVLPLVYVFII